MWCNMVPPMWGFWESYLISYGGVQVGHSDSGSLVNCDMLSSTEVSDNFSAMSLIL